MRVLLLTYEFTFAPFSGNGMLARSLAKSLLALGCHLRVLCCRPTHVPGLAADNHLSFPEVLHAESLELWPVELSEAAGWRRLDESSAYTEFWEGVLRFGSSAAEFAPEAVIAIDWTGAGAWRRLRQAIWPDATAPKLCYLNFRVYASGSVAETSWFDEMETIALREAARVLALSPADTESLAQLQLRSQHAVAAPIHILMPPLRSDLEELARGSNGNLTLLKSALPQALERALAAAGRSRVFVTCAVRLSREKEPMRFVEFVEAAAGRLKDLGLTPLLFGAPADAEYSAAVKSRLQAASTEAVIIDEFMPPVALAAAFSATALNFHPCRYDAYGMSIVEAAAFGAPSVINAGTTVGALQLLPASQGASFVLLFDGKISDNALSEEVLHLLEDEAQLKSVGITAQKLALQWSEAAYGAALLSHLRQLAEEHCSDVAESPAGATDSDPGA
ncbi:hypothetical protein AB1Y20_000744 [Prymnesium parvum]|uniref:Uncharacterized protein n=1 Tax=Prymnesium parvum TaxID=97485 RepID=A0AB34K907_PRYPA